MKEPSVVDQSRERLALEGSPERYATVGEGGRVPVLDRIADALDRVAELDGEGIPVAIRPLGRR